MNTSNILTFHVGTARTVGSYTQLIAATQHRGYGHPSGAHKSIKTPSTVSLAAQERPKSLSTRNFKAIPPSPGTNL